MSDKVGKNRLKILINKIAVNADNMGLVEELIKGLSKECFVSTFSVRRWMNNGSQPTSSNLNKIILYLNQYDSSITFSDFFESHVSNGTKISVPFANKLVR